METTIEEQEILYLEVEEDEGQGVFDFDRMADDIDRKMNDAFDLGV